LQNFVLIGSMRLLCRSPLTTPWQQSMQLWQQRSSSGGGIRTTWCNCVTATNEGGRCQKWQSTSSGNQLALAIKLAGAINWQGQSTSRGNQLAGAINRQGQSTGRGNQPAVTVETALPLATLQCGAVSSDSGRTKQQEETQTNNQ